MALFYFLWWIATHQFEEHWARECNRGSWLVCPLQIPDGCAHSWGITCPAVLKDKSYSPAQLSFPLSVIVRAVQHFELVADFFFSKTLTF